MKWNAFNSSASNCFVNNISVGKQLEKRLYSYKQYIRGRITDTFKELTEYLLKKQGNWYFEVSEFKVFNGVTDDVSKLC